MIDFVVAKYQEDISWIKDIVSQTNNKLFVYDKSPDPIEGSIPLPNVGREAHTYLHHIITHYDSIKNSAVGDKTFFLQGHIKDHLHIYNCTTETEFIDKMKNNSEQHAIVHQVGGTSAFFDFRISWHNNHNVIANRENMAFGQWFEKHIGIAFHDNIRWWIAALFCVENWRITQHPIEFYIRLIEQLASNANPEEAHFMERSWFVCFYPEEQPFYGVYQMMNRFF